MRNSLRGGLGLLAAVSLIGVAASSAHAQAFSSVYYDFTGNAGTEVSQAPASSPTGATLSSLTRGSGISANAGANSLNSSSWNTASIDLTAYYAFTITPNAGKTVSLSNLSFLDQRSGTGPTNFELRSSIDNFAAALFSYTYLTTDQNNLSQNIDLSGVSSVQNVAGPIELRLYGYGASAAAGTYRLRSPSAGTGVSLSGSVGTAATAVVPEASTFALASMGMLPLAAVAVRRRRKAA